MEGERKYAVAKQIREKKLPRAGRQNSRDQVHFNAVTLPALESTGPGSKFLAFEFLTRDRVAVDRLEEKIDGAVTLNRSRSERTGWASFGPVLAERPDLKVEKGRLRMIPWTIDPESNRFILELDQEENVPVPPRGTKKAPDPKTHPTNL